MSATSLEADYLVVGAGAGGLAFADALLAESDRTIAIVDERARPGGHWNDAYRFVRLHLPSAYYGVSSTPLGTGAIDSSGPNKGLSEVASGAEISAYYERVMERMLLPSGRVRYFPGCRYEGGNRFTSLVTGETREVVVRRKLVDATYVAGAVPSRHKPAYSVAPGVRHVPVNGLADIQDAPGRYVVIGSGKTGIDACLWLLDHGVDPDRVTWVMPQDAWLLDRTHVQPGDQFQEVVLTALATQMEAAAAAESIADLFARMEREGLVLRIDENVWPTAYRCALVTQWELRELRRITNVVRLGRVKAVEADRVVLDGGEIPTSGDTLHVDCSAKGVAPKPARPIFSDGRITLQFVRTCQPAFSAAMIGVVEAHFDDDARKNALCGVVSSPERDVDLPLMTLVNAKNAYGWSREPSLQQWLSRTRLDIFPALQKPDEALTPRQQAARNRLRGAFPAAMANLQRLVPHSGECSR